MLRSIIRPPIEPVSRSFGFDRGKPIDRVYIESFLQAHAADIRGTVLEIGDSTYTRLFGGNSVTCSEVLHAVPGNPEASIQGDLATGAGIPAEMFDCIILTQTLPFIFDVHQAVLHSMKALKSGGVVLATMPGICQISRYDMDRWGDYWRFTDLSARQLFEDIFGVGNIDVSTYGNVLTACAFLQGYAAHEFRAAHLNHKDPDYQVLIGVRARRPVTGGSASICVGQTESPAC